MHKEEGEKLIVLAKSTTSGGREASVEDFDHLERGRPSVEDFDVEVFDVRDFDSSPPVRLSKKAWRILIERKTKQKSR